MKERRKRFQQRTFAVKTLKILYRNHREWLTYIFFDMRAILEGYYQLYEKCVNMKPRIGRVQKNGSVHERKRRFLV